MKQYSFDTRLTEAEIFFIAVGRGPEDDDLDRAFCGCPGELGHRQCGWCIEHDKPYFICGCTYKETK